MQYQNYKIETPYTNIGLEIKFTNLIDGCVYKKLVKPEDLTDLSISKFIKLLENSIKQVNGYTMEIDEENNLLVLFLSFESDLLDISQTIYLDKNNITNQSDIVNSESLIELKNRINLLENVIKEKNLITIAKIYNLETYNYNFSSITNKYLKYSPDTESIEIILPDDIYDITTDKRNSFTIEFNLSIDPTEYFTRLKKLTLSNFYDIRYFCSTYIYTCPEINTNTNTNTTNSEYLVYYNNTIEEIINTNKLNTPRFDFRIKFKDYDSRINELKKHNHELNSSSVKIIGLNNDIGSHTTKIIKFSFPKLKKICFTTIIALYFENILHLIKGCTCLTNLEFNKIKFTKCCPAETYQKKLQEIKLYCQTHNIKLEICEIVYDE